MSSKNYIILKAIYITILNKAIFQILIEKKSKFLVKKKLLC